VNADHVAFSVRALRRTARDAPCNVTIGLGVRRCAGGVWVYRGGGGEDGVVIVYVGKTAAAKIRPVLNMRLSEADAEAEPYFCPSSKGW
jgi:hypothetical protein